MQSAFVTGFVKSAVDLGYDDETIARVFKRAMANPQMGQMFKALPSQPGSMPVAPEQLQALAQAQQMMKDPAQMQVLQQMLAQQQGPQTV